MTLKSSDDRSLPDCFPCLEESAAKNRSDDSRRRAAALSDIDLLRVLSGLDALTRPRGRTAVRKIVRRKRSTN